MLTQWDDNEWYWKVYSYLVINFNKLFLPLAAMMKGIILGHQNISRLFSANWNEESYTPILAWSR